MDAMAVSICKGLSMQKLNAKKIFIIGFYFGFFQALMPIIGYYLGSTFKNAIINLDHWIAFTLLVILGINMIREANTDKETINDKVNFKTMLPLSLATSIDALAIGITFSFLKVNLLMSVLIIGLTTFILSILGAIVGNKFGVKYEKTPQILGGLILIIIGTKILLEHLSII